MNLGNDLFAHIINIAYRDQHWFPFLLKKYNLNCHIFNNKSIFLKSGLQTQQFHNYVDFFNHKIIIAIVNYVHQFIIFRNI